MLHESSDHTAVKFGTHSMDRMYATATGAISCVQSFDESSAEFAPYAGATLRTELWSNGRIGLIQKLIGQYRTKQSCELIMAINIHY